MKTLKSQALSGLTWQLLEVAGRQMMSLVVFSTLARLLEPEAFGLVGMVTVYLTIVTLFVDLGVGTAIIQRREVQPEHLDSAFWLGLALATLLSLLTIALAGVCAVLLKEPRLGPLLRVGSLSLVISSLSSVQIAVFVRAMDFRRPAIRTVVANIVGGVVGVAMAFTQCGVWALIGQQLASAIASTVFVWRASTWRPTRRFSRTALRELLGMGSAVFASMVCFSITSRADQFFIGRFLGSAALGTYVVGGKLSDVARLALHQPIAAVALPAVAKLQDDHVRLRQACYSTMRLIGVVAFPAFLGLWAIAPAVVPLLFGPKWVGSVTSLQLLSLLTLVNMLQVLFHPLMISSGTRVAFVTMHAASATCAVVACCIGVQWGLESVILGLIASSMAVGVCTFGYLRRRLSLSAVEFWRPCVLPAIAGCAMAALVLRVPPFLGAAPTVAIKVILGAGFYALAYSILDPSGAKQMLEQGRGLVRRGSGRLAGDSEQV